MDWSALVDYDGFHGVVEEEDYEYDYNRECKQQVADMFVFHFYSRKCGFKKVTNFSTGLN